MYDRITNENILKCYYRCSYKKVKTREVFVPTGMWHEDGGDFIFPTTYDYFDPISFVLHKGPSGRPHFMFATLTEVSKHSWAPCVLEMEILDKEISKIQIIKDTFILGIKFFDL